MKTHRKPIVLSTVFQPERIQPLQLAGLDHRRLAGCGQRLAGAVIPQAHPTEYPLYRLEWQSLGSLPRQLRNCLTGMRAAPYSYGALEMIELELFLGRRARGLTLETPAVRP